MKRIKDIKSKKKNEDDSGGREEDIHTNEITTIKYQFVDIMKIKHDQFFSGTPINSTIREPPSYMPAIGTIYTDRKRDENLDKYIDETYCSRCNESLEYCHNIEYAEYCSATVMEEFENDPFSMDTTKISVIYTNAYNRALDFGMFERFNYLKPHGVYFLPSCLKADMRKVTANIESRIKLLASGKYDVLRDLKHIDDPDSDSNEEEVDDNNDDLSYLTKEEIKRIKMDKNLCNKCGKNRTNCHLELFGDYCYHHLVRTYEMYPTLMNTQNCELIYLKVYNSALDIVSFSRTWRFTKKNFHYPPPCLASKMNHDVHFVATCSTEYLETHKDEHRTEFDEKVEFGIF